MQVKNSIAVEGPGGMVIVRSLLLEDDGRLVSLAFEVLDADVKSSGPHATLDEAVKAMEDAHNKWSLAEGTARAAPINFS